MSDNKRYYWLKLNENFFEEDTIAWLEEQENGKDYVIFYLKLCLKSLQDDGKLIRYVGAKLMPYDVKALSKLTNTAIDTVAVAMKTFNEIGLIEKLETGEIFLTQIDEVIGSETEVAKRVRKHRAKQVVIENKHLLQSNIEVTKSNTEIEIDKELDKDILSCKQDVIPFKEIVGYLNQQANTNFRASGADTKKHIKARWNDGFRLNDFKKVIDVKTKQWLNDPKMKGYLRPGTLFGPKFEGYLNECQETGPQGNWREAEALRTQRELAEIYGEQS